jgi:hypothetical protein
VLAGGVAQQQGGGGVAEQQRQVVAELQGLAVEELQVMAAAVVAEEMQAHLEVVVTEEANLFAAGQWCNGRLSSGGNGGGTAIRSASATGDGNKPRHDKKDTPYEEKREERASRVAKASKKGSGLCSTSLTSDQWYWQ